MYVYPTALTKGRLLKRYKRFLADVRLPDGQEVVAHCGNPGSMMGLAEPGSTVYLSANTNPKAKLDWRWEIATQAVATGETLVGINTSLPNRIVENAVRAGGIAELSGYASLRPEVKYGKNSRIDLLLESPKDPPCYVEVKSVTLRRPDGPDPDAAEFPDAVTARGTKHLGELEDMVREGARAVMFYLVQRSDCSHIRIAADIDPVYDDALVKAQANGVEILCYDCQIGPKRIDIGAKLHLVPSGA